MARPKETPALVVEPPKEDEAKTAVPAQNCGNCACSYFDLKTGQGFCRHAPPQHFLYIVPQQNSITGKQEATPMQWSAWPVVRSKQFCITGWRAKPKDMH